MANSCCSGYLVGLACVLVLCCAPEQVKSHVSRSTPARDTHPRASWIVDDLDVVVHMVRMVEVHLLRNFRSCWAHEMHPQSSILKVL